jgi:hypothetical protein
VAGFRPSGRRWYLRVDSPVPTTRRTLRGMAARGWANSTVTAIGAAAGAGAAGLGLGYGLSIVVWQPVRDAAGETLWLGSLAWVAWIAATSTVLGAVYANGLGTRAASRARRAVTGGAGTPAKPGSSDQHGRAVELAWRTAIAVAAAIGAAITIPLVMLPARAAHRADNFQPQVTAAAYAIIGIIAGLVIAVIAVNVRVIAANLLGSVAWVWGLAAISVIDSVRAHRTVGTAQLAAWQFTEGGWFRETLYVPGALLMLGGALLVGVFAALPADRREDSRVAIAVSGAVGPLLVATAYFVAAPRLTLRTEQLSAYLFAPYAVLAGFAGSLLVAALGPMRPRRPKPPKPAPAFPAPFERSTITPAGGGGPADKPATPVPVAAPADDDLTDWTRTLGATTESKTESKTEPLTASGAGKTDETTLRLDTKGTDPYSSSRAYVSEEPVAATGGGDPAESPAPGTTGRATVVQPLWPEKPKPRKRRG